MKIFIAGTVFFATGFVALAMDSGYSQASSAPIFDVVADLDWTLIYPTTSEMQKAAPEHVIEADGKLFRLSDFAAEAIRALHQLPNVRISYFSGGTSERNKAVIEALYREIRALPGAGNFKPHLVLDKNHMKVISTDPNLRFAQRFTKDLNQYFDPKQTIIIEDMKELLPANLQENVLWLGRTYNDRPRFELSTLEDPAQREYSAPNYQEWKKERLKIVRALGLIVAAREMAINEQGSFRDALQKVLVLETNQQMDPFLRGSRVIQKRVQSCRTVRSAS